MSQRATEAFCEFLWLSAVRSWRPLVSGTSIPYPFLPDKSGSTTSRHDHPARGRGELILIIRIEKELVRMGPEIDRIALVKQLVLDVVLDQILREDVALQKEVVIVCQSRKRRSQVR